MDLECKKKEDEALNLKRELDYILSDLNRTRMERDKQEQDNGSIQLQNQKLEENIVATCDEIQTY